MMHCIFSRKSFTIIIVLLLLACRKSTSNPDCGNYYSIVNNIHQELKSLQWRPAGTGLVLQENDAVLVCQDSQLTLKTEAPPFDGQACTIKDDYSLCKIDGNQMVVIRGKAKAVIEQVSGKVYFTNDREIIKKFGKAGFAFGEENVKKERFQRYDLLDTLYWNAAKKGEELNPWSIIHVTAGSTVELKVERGTIWVSSPDLKEVNDRLFISGNTYLIISPSLFQSAVIVNISGSAYISEEPEKIKEFHQTRGIYFIKRDDH